MSERLPLDQDDKEHITSYYHFEGDEQVSHKQYGECITAGYVSSVSTLHGGAEYLGVHLDNETIERWRRLGASAGLLDDFLDESPDRVRAHSLYRRGITEGAIPHQEVPTWTDRRMVPALLLLRNALQVLPQNQQHYLKESALIIGDISLEKAKCYSIERYKELLFAEAHHTARLVYESLSPQLRTSPQAQLFARWCEEALTLGTLFDSARDIWEDAEAGRTQVEPKIQNCLKIALAARSSLFSLTLNSQNRRASQRSLLRRIRKQD